MNFLKKGLSGTAIKIIALVTMTFDHLGVILFPGITFLRVVGRIAMPIFAYMIAEGCRYTKNKAKRFLLIFLLGLICQIVYYFAYPNWNLNILIDFSISILIIYAVQYAIKLGKWQGWLLPLGLTLLTAFCVYVLPNYVGGGTLYFDYGFFCIMSPVFVYIFKDKRLKLLVLALALLPISLYSILSIQWYCYLALIPLALYNGQRGKYKMKYFFYLYYPAHIGVFYLIAMIF